METVEKILRNHGYESVEELEIGEQITVEVTGFQDLVIEKIGENRVAVGHYYTQRGDLMSDPEIVFKISDGSEWIPIRYTQHPDIHHHDELGLPTVKEFNKQWSENLKRQGFVEAAKKDKKGKAR